MGEMFGMVGFGTGDWGFICIVSFMYIYTRYVYMYLYVSTPYMTKVSCFVGTQLYF